MATGYTQRQISSRGLKWKFRFNISPLARVRSERGRGPGGLIAGPTAKQYHPTVLLALVATAWVFSYSLDAEELKASQPNLELIVDSSDRAEEQNPALTRPYKVTRQYKVFRGDDPKPASEVTGQISFTPPDIKTFKITEAQGNPRGEKIVTAFWNRK